MGKRNIDFSLFKILKRHSRIIIGDPLSQVVTTLQDVALREQKLQQNPSLKHRFNQFTGDQYILKLDKQPKRKSLSSTTAN